MWINRSDILGSFLVQISLLSILYCDVLNVVSLKTNVVFAKVFCGTCVISTSVKWNFCIIDSRFLDIVLSFVSAILTLINLLNAYYVYILLSFIYLVVRLHCQFTKCENKFFQKNFLILLIFLLFGENGNMMPK